MVRLAVRPVTDFARLVINSQRNNSRKGFFARDEHLYTRTGPKPNVPKYAPFTVQAISLAARKKFGLRLAPIPPSARDKSSSAAVTTFDQAQCRFNHDTALHHTLRLSSVRRTASRRATQPRIEILGNCLPSPPDHICAPSEARAEADEHQKVTGLNAARLDSFI